MGTLGILVRRSARKSRALIVATVLLATLASALLTLGTLASAEFPKAFDQQLERLHGEDILVATMDDGFAGKVAAGFKADVRVATVDEEPVRAEFATFTYSGVDTSMLVLYSDASVTPGLGQSRIIERRDGVADPIYLPLLFRVNGGFELGDEFRIRPTGAPPRTFHVAGFFENTFLGTTSMGVTGFLVPHDDYTALAASADAPRATHAVRVTTVASVAEKDIEGLSNDVLDAAPMARPTFYVANDRATMRDVILLDVSLISALLLGFAGIVAVAIVATIAFLVRTSVARDMTAIGVQKAMGLTSGTIMAATFLPAVLAALAGLALGTGVAYAVTPWLAGALGGQSGLPWSATFSPLALVVAAAVVVGGALLSSCLASLSVRRITTVNALKGGAATHNRRHNPLPLDRTAGALPVLLGIKQGLRSPGQAVAVTAVVALVSFATVFSLALGSDVLGNNETLRQVTVGEVDDVAAVVSDPTARERILAEVSAMPEVRRALYLDWFALRVEGRKAMVAVTKVFDFAEHPAIYEGREPRHADEVAIGGALASRVGARIGEQLELAVGDRTEKFLLVGLLSSAQMFGSTAHLTTEGYERFAPGFVSADLSIHLRDGASASAMTDHLNTAYGKQISSVANTHDTVTGALRSYEEMSRTFGTGMVVLSIVLVATVMGLLTSSLLTRDRRSMGIRRALGHTTGELMTQTLWGYLPPCLLGAGIGAVAGLLGTQPVLLILLRAIGIMRLDLPQDHVRTAVVALGVVAVAAATVLLVSLRVRRISAYELLSE